MSQNAAEIVLNIQEDFDTKIQPILDRQVYAVAQTIVSGMFSGLNPKDISFRNVLNRLMVLIQQAATFVVMNDKTGKEHYRSNKHPVDITNIDNSILESLKKKGSRFEIFGSHYSLLVLMYVHDPSKRNFRIIKPNRISVTQKPVIKTESHLIAYSIDKILDESTYSHYSEGVLAGLRESVERCSNEPVDNDSTYEPVDVDVLKEVGEKINTMLLRNRSLTFSGLRDYGCLDHVFNKVKNNLNELMKFHCKVEGNADLSPANYVLFTRDFSRKRDSHGKIIKRHDEYDYNIQIALCDSQRNDILSYFRRLENKDIGKYSDGITSTCSNNSKDAWVVPLADDTDDWLAGLLSETNSTKKEENLSEIIKVLESPFGDTSRSAIDPVFDGVVFFRRKFVDGGIKRCFTDAMKKVHPKNIAEIENGTYFQILRNDDATKNCVEHYEESAFSKSLANDLKRLAITYYLYNGMAGVGNNNNENTEMSILITPFEIGGKIWACAGYFTLLPKSVNQEKKEICIKKMTEVFWLNYHIYLDVDVRLRRDLRLSLIECYYDILAYYYAQCFQDENLTEIANLCEKKDYDWGKACTYWIEQRYTAITAYLPYESIKINFYDGKYGLRKKDNRIENNVFPINIMKEKRDEDIVSLVENPTNEPDNHGMAGVFLTNTKGAILSKSENKFFQDVAAGTLRAKDFSQFSENSVASNVKQSDGSKKSVVNMRDLEIRLTGAILRAYSGLKPAAVRRGA